MGLPVAVALVALVVPAGLAWATAASADPPERPSATASSVSDGGTDTAGNPVPRSGAVTALPGEPRPSFVGTWAWPVPGQPVLRRLFDPPDVRWGSGHRGVDLETPAGGPIRAPTDGTVTFAGRVAGRDVLVLTSAGGLRSTFEPVLPAVPVGTDVAAGSVVGTLTATAGHCAPATCLHWGVLRGTVYLDPLRFLRSPVVLLPTR